MKKLFLVIIGLFIVMGLFSQSGNIKVTNNSSCNLVIQIIGDTICSTTNCQTNPTYIASGNYAILSPTCTWTAAHKWNWAKYYKISTPPTSGGVCDRNSSCGGYGQAYICNVNYINCTWTTPGAMWEVEISD